MCQSTSLTDTFSHFGANQHIYYVNQQSTYGSYHAKSTYQHGLVYPVVLYNVFYRYSALYRWIYLFIYIFLPFFQFLMAISLILKVLYNLYYLLFQQ